jgi:hypothetical protein
MSLMGSVESSMAPEVGLPSARNAAVQHRRKYRAAGLDVNGFMQHAKMDRRVRNLPANDDGDMDLHALRSLLAGRRAAPGNTCFTYARCRLQRTHGDAAADEDREVKTRSAAPRPRGRE